MEVYVEGGPGSGKTILLAKLIEFLTAEGYTVTKLLETELGREGILVDRNTKTG